MPESVGHEAAKPNPSLQPLAILVGTWHTVGTHPLVPGTTFHGRTTFEWSEGGAFLIMRSQMEEPEIPDGIAVFGTDDATGECSMLYFDERGVSRRYEVSLQGNVWKWWRNAPGLSQRFAGPPTYPKLFVREHACARHLRNWRSVPSRSSPYSRISRPGSTIPRFSTDRPAPSSPACLQPAVPAAPSGPSTHCSHCAGSRPALARTTRSGALAPAPCSSHSSSHFSQQSA